MYFRKIRRFKRIFSDVVRNNRRRPKLSYYQKVNSLIRRGHSSYDAQRIASNQRK